MHTHQQASVLQGSFLCRYQTGWETHTWFCHPSPLPFAQSALTLRCTLIEYGESWDWHRKRERERESEKGERDARRVFPFKRSHVFRIKSNTELKSQMQAWKGGVKYRLSFTLMAHTGKYYKTKIANVITTGVFCSM